MNPLELPVPSRASSDDRTDPNFGMKRLVAAVQELSLARNMETIMTVVRKAARELTGADGATFVLRDGDQCHYAEENAIGPLWKGKRFPMSACISGWVMMNRKPATIEDIYIYDSRIPLDAYRPTFVRSLLMVPIRTEAPIGAIGNYWAARHLPSEIEIELLQALANTTSVAMENVRVYAEMEHRIQDRTARLKEANEELETFAHTISHDLRTPLRAISGFCSELEVKHQLSEDARFLFQQIAGNAERMGALIDGLLKFSQFSQHALFKQPVQMAPLVREVIELLGVDSYGRRIDFQIGEIADCMADPVLLKQVLVNLVSNAIKFTREKTDAHIEIASEKQNGETVYFVRDNGAGFDMANAERLFTVFHRLHRQEDYEGTGVGLSIVQRIVQRHGGRIWAESSPGAGATFKFTLPD